MVRIIDKKTISRLLIIYKIIFDTNNNNNYKLIKNLPECFIDKIFNYNKEIISNQIKNILKIILEVNNIDNILYNFNWCKKYDINNY